MDQDELKTDKLLLAAVKYDSHDAFVSIFRMYYTDLVLFAGQFVDDPQACEDIVQDVFVKLWTGRKTIDIDKSLKSYLVIMVRNQAINELRRTHVRQQYNNSIHEQILSLSPEEHMFYTELSDALDKAVDALDPTLRHTYSLSVEQHLSYPQIAEKTGITVRAVEKRMSRIMRHLRQVLDDFNPLITIAIIFTDFII